MSTTSYDCSKCHGYCCSIYEVIAVTPDDVKRFARGKRITIRQAWKEMAVEIDGGFRLRRKKDRLLGRICRFFDTKKRSCSIYKLRPDVCRDYPGQKKCAYYDALQFERTTQDLDPSEDVVHLVQIRIQRRPS